MSWSSPAPTAWPHRSIDASVSACSSPLRALAPFRADWGRQCDEPAVLRTSGRTSFADLRDHHEPAGARAAPRRSTERRSAVRASRPSFSQRRPRCPGRGWRPPASLSGEGSQTAALTHCLRLRTSPACTTRPKRERLRSSCSAAGRDLPIDDPHQVGRTDPGSEAYLKRLDLAACTHQHDLRPVAVGVVVDHSDAAGTPLTVL